MFYRSIEEAIIIRMGFSYIYHTKKGYDSAYYIRFQGAQQENRQKTIPHPKNQYHITGAGRLHHATALDLNMGYYTIRLDPMAVEMCTIIFPF